jgi:hydrogenase expression/formation protein HypE
VSQETGDFNCPLPHSDDERIELAHGGGGRRMQDFLRNSVFPRFDNPLLAAGTDAAIIQLEDRRLAFTTDSFVVNPPFFPGGDIGVLAVCGTLNDLACVGATPRWLSAALIIEEGFATVRLERILDSMAQTARTAGVELVTGDTKVVERGKADGIFINTAGVGLIEHSADIAPASIRPGDAILVSGDLGRHGVAVLAARESLLDSVPVDSDVANIYPVIEALLTRGVALHCVRDLTRGGLVSALVELAGQAAMELLVEEQAIPVSEPVAAACELLGFDPLYVANVARFVAVLPRQQAEKALAVLQEHNVSAALIGRVTGPGHAALLQSRYGPVRRLAMLSGEQMPRIC